MLDHLGLSRKLSKQDQYHFFQAAQATRQKVKAHVAADAHVLETPSSPFPGLNPSTSHLETNTKETKDRENAALESDFELDYFELKWCVRAMAEHLHTDLDNLVGQALDSYFADENSLEKVELADNIVWMCI